MTPDIRQEDLSFFVGHGVKLAARIFHPVQQGPAPGVVLCHGFGGTKIETVPPMARLFAENGYRAFTFDYRGFGDSEGAKNRVAPFEQIEDVVTAVEFFAARDDVDRTKICLYGNSFGGGVVSGALPRLNIVKSAVISVPGVAGSRRMDEFPEHKQKMLARAREALVQKARGEAVPVVDRSEMLNPDPATEERYRGQSHPITLESFLLVSRGYDPIDWAHRITQPLFIIAIRSDKTTPLKYIEEFHSRLACEKGLHVFPTGHHYSPYTDLLSETFDLTRAWFARHIS